MPRGYWWSVEIAALCAYLAIPGLVLANYASLPPTIATHFGWNGTPNRFGDKSTLFFVAATATFVYGILSATPWFPGLINIPGPRTPAKIQSGIALIRIVKLEVTAFLAYLVWAMIQTGLGLANGINGTLHEVFLVSVLATIAIGLYICTRNAN